jgi:hypothetical protein
MSKKLATIPTIVELELHWQAVFATRRRVWRFPARTTSSMRRACNQPAVYCWRIEWPRGRTREVYVGETENLLKRMRGVLSPCVEDNRRLHEYLGRAVEQGAEVTLEMLRFEPFVLNLCVISEEKLGNPHVRRLLESMAIVSEVTAGAKLLNRSRSLLQKQKEKFFPTFVKMGREEQERFLKYLRKREEREGV